MILKKQRINVKVNKLNDFPFHRDMELDHVIKHMSLLRLFNT